MKELLRDYKNKKREIKNRLDDFKEVYKRSNRHIFAELCFCILTPQSKALTSDRAIRNLKAKGLLFKGSQEDIAFYLKGVRFPNNKAKYLVGVRDFFKNGKAFDIKSKIDKKDLFKTRDWLVKNVKGLGYKEASHFLRNVGLGGNLAILDRHILKNLKRYGIIKDIPVSLSRKKYMDIEKRMKDFFESVNIPIEEVDLLLWSKETGVIFK